MQITVECSFDRSIERTKPISSAIKGYHRDRCIPLIGSIGKQGSKWRIFCSFFGTICNPWNSLETSQPKEPYLVCILPSNLFSILNLLFLVCSYRIDLLLPIFPIFQHRLSIFSKFRSCEATTPPGDSVWSWAFSLHHAWIDTARKPRVKS